MDVCELKNYVFLTNISHFSFVFQFLDFNLQKYIIIIWKILVLVFLLSLITQALLSCKIISFNIFYMNAHMLLSDIFKLCYINCFVVL